MIHGQWLLREDRKRRLPRLASSSLGAMAFMCPQKLK
jgi:hypothetical protein